MMKGETIVDATIIDAPSSTFTEKEAADRQKKAYLSKDKPCILKKRLNGVFDQNAGLIIQRFLNIRFLPAREVLPSQTDVFGRISRKRSPRAR